MPRSRAASQPASQLASGLILAAIQQPEVEVVVADDQRLDGGEVGRASSHLLPAEEVVGVEEANQPTSQASQPAKQPNPEPEGGQQAVSAE